MRRLLRHGGWWTRDYLYAVIWQVRAFVDRTDPAMYREGTETPILVIPGVYETWRFLLPLVAELHGRGHPVHVLEPLRRNRRPVADTASLAAEYLRDHGLREVVIVAHSKGGLIGKHLMAFAPEAERISGMVAIATPFRGSRYAQLMMAPTLRALAPSDATILALARETAIDSRIVSVWARFDPHIPGGCELPGAKNVEVDTGGHFRILAHPRVIAEVLALAAR